MVLSTNNKNWEKLQNQERRSKMVCSKCDANISHAGEIKVNLQMYDKTGYRLTWVRPCSSCGRDHFFELSGEIDFRPVE